MNLRQPIKIGYFTQSVFTVYVELTALVQARPEGEATGAICPRPPSSRGPLNYIASLLCRELVDGSQETVRQGPPNKFKTNKVFLYITDEDQISFTNLLNRIIEPRLVFPRPRLFGVENEKALPSSAISAKVISMTLLLCVSGYLLRLGASLGKSSPARKFRVPGTAMGCSIPENVLF